jgi:NAD+ synthase (glutamine-hydrolysing)
MKILLAQLNMVVGAIEDNAARVRETIEYGRAEGVELVIFPEAILTGYPPQDLLEYPSFVKRNEQALESLASATDERTGALVGYIARNQLPEGKGLFNGAALLGEGRVLSRHFKTLLPTYDVFDERRWFDPAPQLELAEWRGKRIAITICEDCWNSPTFASPLLYKEDPIEKLRQLAPDFLVNISATPFALGKRQVKRRLFSEVAVRCECPVIHVNLVGGNDSLIFDGGSNFFSAAGQLKAQAWEFREDLLPIDLDAATGVVRVLESEELELLRQALVLGLRDYASKCGFRQCALGLSGGIDSALTAVLAAEALGPKNVLGVSMPSQYSSAHSRDDAQALAENLGIEFRTLPIERMFGAVLEELTPLFGDAPPDTAEENIQARLRGMALMALSNKFGRLILATGNKSESAVGYATLYGDMCGGLAVIGDLSKTTVYKMARHINRHGEVIPQSTIDKPPSAELRPGQRDSDALPDYAELDVIVEAYVERHMSVEELVAEGAGEQTVRRVVRMIDLAEHKRRQGPPILKVTGKAFGFGRRMPIAARFGPLVEK